MNRWAHRRAVRCTAGCCSRGKSSWLKATFVFRHEDSHLFTQFTDLNVYLTRNSLPGTRPMWPSQAATCHSPWVPGVHVGVVWGVLRHPTRHAHIPALTHGLGTAPSPSLCYSHTGQALDHPVWS